MPTAQAPSAHPTSATTTALQQATDLRASGRHQEADDLCRHIVSGDPLATPAWLQLVGSALSRSEIDAGASLLDQAIAIHPAPPLLHALALIRLRQRHGDALPLLEKAAAAAPDDAGVRANLGNALHQAGRLHEAIGCYRAALSIDPRLVNTRASLASALRDAGDMRSAIAEFEHAISLAPSDLGLVSNLLWAHCHRDDLGAAELYALHRQWGRHFAARGATPAFQRPAAGRPVRLKVGIVSADLRDHAVALFLRPVLEQLDRARFSIHAYSCGRTVDEVTEVLRPLCDVWVEAAPLPDNALATRIRADGIDVLVDLSGHTGGNRLRVFASRAAPVQATWIGYPCTTGVSAMDYLLADPILAPPGEIDAAFTEKVVRLPGAATFQPPFELPPVRPLPALERGFVTFGSFHRPAKLGEATLQSWIDLMRRVPTSRLLLGHCGDLATRDAMAARFTAGGVDASRLSFRPRVPMAEFLSLHDEVDLALDAFSFSGGTTTLHSLFMGVPVVTAMGRTMAARQTGTILTHAGLQAFVASSPLTFGDVALQWTGQLDELAALRLQLRQRLLDRPLLRDSQVPRAFGAAMDAMWDRWARGLAPAAITVSEDAVAREGTT